MSWPELPLGGLPIDIIDGDRGKNYPKQNEFQEEGYCVFLSATNVTKGGFKFDAVQFIDEQKDSALRKGKLSRNDVVLTTRGTIGNSAFFNESIPYENMRINSGMVILRVVPDKFYAPFLYSYLRSQSFLKKVDSIRSGAAQPQLPIRDLVTVKIPCPDISEQIRASKFISTYDDLIENNRRRIQLLEESARLLYQEWFVHLRFPGHEQVRITDGVPDGWEKKPLTAIAAVNQTSLKKGFDERIEYIDISCVSTHSISDTTWYEFAEAPGRARRIVKHCDILWSCVRPNRRSHVLVWEPHDRLIASTGFAVISATQVSPFFLYQSLITNDYVGYLTNRAGGAAYPAVTAKVFEESLVLVPNRKLIEQYDDQVKDTYAQINMLRSQNAKLAQARDLLLPKLMSGELAV